MSIFSSYARYYDLLYRDKDYVRESRFIHQLIQSYTPEARSILELGCGTGNHAVLLAKEGYTSHGIDLSEAMLQKAHGQLSQVSPELASRLKFSRGDIRNIRLNQTFDVILSLFHVISYQITNEDLTAAFNTVQEHLKPNGIFIFDIWYGPAVLTQRPVVRVKRWEDEEIIVTRIAEPVIYPNENLVDVNYQVFIRHKNSNTVEELQETHQMRYLFFPEINQLLHQSGFKIIDSGEWMTKLEVGFNTWGIYFVVQT